MKFAAAMISMLSAPLSGGTGRALLRLGWTLVTMTTLGFGDIVFESDLGRMYSVVVLLSGALLLLILLPFTFIQLVYLPWRAAVRAARAPRTLPEDTTGHVLLTGRSPVEETLMRRCRAAGVPYVLIVEDVEQAAILHDDGYPVLVGAFDDPDTYRAARAEAAAMLVTARNDQANTNVAFTFREVTEGSVLVVTANSQDSVDVLELAGATCVLQLGELLGRAFARRILAPTARSSVIATVEDLVIAETSTAGTPLVGKTLADLDLRERFGVSVVGLWDRGQLRSATPERTIEDTSILLLAGRREQVAAYDEAFAPGETGEDDGGERSDLVVILGGGRVGRAVAHALTEAGTDYAIVDRIPERIGHLPGAVVGDAADLDVLRRAGIEKASAVVVTTHDDDTNIYLTLYCRRLRPDAEILGRVALERNVTTMHRAAADFVLSYAAMGGIEAWNAIREDSTLLLAEGLVVFRVTLPAELAGRSLAATSVREDTGCTVIGIVRAGTCTTSLDPDQPLPADAELLLIGDDECEERFFQRYVAAPPRTGLRRWWPWHSPARPG